MSEVDNENRCGVWPLCTGKDDPFIEMCAWHDKAYTKGSWQQKHMARKRVDDHFLDMMLCRAGGCTPLRIRAYAYYQFARWFGGALWEGK